jgi:hypothetical protein
MFPANPKTLGVDSALNATGDEWIRYSFSNWIVWTEKPASEISRAVRGGLGSDDQVIVAELNLNERDGWAAKWIWEWLDSRKPGVRNSSLAEILSQSGPHVGGISALSGSDESPLVRALRNLKP